jgi:N-acetylglucosaminyl-diphospho-decaprenol L-rhamnosyltransferase
MDARTRSRRVTVAVVSWNTRALLHACLESLREDSDAGHVDVWVLDNASSDGSAELVREQFPWVELIASGENLGFGPAVNRVAARTTSPWIAPANADIRFAQGALQALVEEGERHPEAGVIAPRLILPDGSTQHSAYPFPTIPFSLAYVTGLTAVSPTLARRWFIDQGFDPSRGREVGWAVGALLLIRRAAWEQVGGFDEGQWMYAEDLDLGWRLSRAGWKARYQPAARVFHDESAATSQAWGAGRYARWHASSYAWQLRRRGPVVARMIAAINVVGYFARAAVLSPLAVAGSGRARALRRHALNAARSHAVGLRPTRVLEQVR